MPLGDSAQRVLAVAALMITWWVTEAVSLPVTALVPLVLFPFTGVLGMGEAARPYSSPSVFLFMGGFVIALAMERWNLHRRIALNIVRLTGTNANGIIFGFMLATALLSMWISNTATTVMMLPIAVSVIGLFITDTTKTSKGQENFGLSIMLGIAYAANVGGLATLIGTPPNSVFVGFMRTTYNYDVDFASWFMVGLPFSVVMLLLSFVVVVYLMYPNRLGNFSSSGNIIEKELEKMGPVSKAEKRVLAVFITTALLWILRGPMSKLLGGMNLSDAGIAMAGAVAMFLVPADFKKGQFLLDWQNTEKLPWGILLLFGGGLSLANAMQETGIVNLIGEAIAQNNTLSVWLIVALLTAVMLFMTELMSNLALITLMLPLVGGIAEGLNLPTMHAAVPVTIAASCAFMLPMATPPNAIVFASGHIKVSQMVRAGVLLNIASVLLLVLLANTLITWIW